MAEFQLPKLTTGVRFPSPAFFISAAFSDRRRHRFRTVSARRQPQTTKKAGRMTCLKALNRSRTGDLILTKDALYLLSYKSNAALSQSTKCIIHTARRVVNRFFYRLFLTAYFQRRISGVYLSLIRRSDVIHRCFQEAPAGKTVSGSFTLSSNTPFAYDPRAFRAIFPNIRQPDSGSTIRESSRRRSTAPDN